MTLESEAVADADLWHYRLAHTLVAVMSRSRVNIGAESQEVWAAAGAADSPAPEIRALALLVAAHWQEYADMVEAEQVMDALGGGR